MTDLWVAAPECTVKHAYGDEGWRPAANGTHEHAPLMWTVYEACDAFERGVALADQGFHEFTKDLHPWEDAFRRVAAWRVWDAQMLSLRVELMERLQWWPEARAALWSTHDANEVEAIEDEVRKCRRFARAGLNELDDVAAEKDWCIIWFNARRAILKGLPE